MAADYTRDIRKHRRIPLLENDGIYCIVIKSKSANNTMALPVRDLSESGFRFSIDLHMKDDFLVGEKLFLKAISGSRNLTFKEPVELRIRWQKDDQRLNLAAIGCEIFNITSRAKRQFIDFIHTEEKFRGLNGHLQSAVRSQNVDAGQETTATGKHQNRHLLKAVSIYGGPRHNGNTAKITSWVEEALVALGHQVERINLFSKKVNGCLGCLRCKSNSSEAGCVQSDDASDIIHKMVASDVVIYASPLYHWGFSAQMKALIDRSHCLHSGAYGTPEHTSLVEGQRQALIVTSSGPFENNAEQILTTFHRMLFSNKAHSAGEFLVCNCSTPDALNNDIKAQTGKFANQISGAAEAPYAILLPGSRNP